jgi:hypothetical protein
VTSIQSADWATKHRGKIDAAVVASLGKSPPRGVNILTLCAPACSNSLN